MFSFLDEASSQQNNDSYLDIEIKEEQLIDEESDDNQLTAYDIAVFYNTYNLRTLLEWWRKRLIIPDFQRAYVWNHKKASEFVDSLLRGLPVPSLFFYDDRENNRFLVVDGLQRLLSLYAYIKEGKFGEKTFKLDGSIHPRWANKSYDELAEEDKDRLIDSLMNVTVMRQLAPDDGCSAMYLAFQRLNTGGITLTAQEVRMAVSYGPLAEYLASIVEDPRFDKWGFIRTSEQKRNKNYAPVQELVLKFWTYFFSYPHFPSGSTRAMLDNFFANNKDFDKDQREGQHSEREFVEAFEVAFQIVNDLPLEVISPYGKPTQTFLEAVWVGLTYRILILHKQVNEAALPKYIKNWKNALGEDKFSEIFRARRTSSASSAFLRIDAGIKYFSEEF